MMRWEVQEGVFELIVEMEENWDERKIFYL